MTFAKTPRTILNRIVASTEIIALDDPEVRRHLATATP